MKNKKKKRTGLYIVGSLAVAAGVVVVISKIKRAVLYIVGYLAVAVGAVVVMSKIIDYLSEKVYIPAIRKD